MKTNKKNHLIILPVVLFLLVIGFVTAEYGMFTKLGIEPEDSDIMMLPECPDTDLLVSQAGSWECIERSDFCSDCGIDDGEDIIGGGYCVPEVDGEHCGIPGTDESTWNTWGVATEDADEQNTKCSEGSMTEVVETYNEDKDKWEKVGFQCEGEANLQSNDEDVIGGGYCVELPENDGCGIPDEDDSTWEFWGVGEHKEEGGHCLQGGETDPLEGEHGIVGFLCRE